MKTLKVSAACVNQTPMDWDANLGRISGAIVEAQADHVDVLCLPELVITGYGCEDMFLAPDTCLRAEQMLKEIFPGSYANPGSPVKELKLKV